jgi:type IV pilus assembly protein PilZ
MAKKKRKKQRASAPAQSAVSLKIAEAADASESIPHVEQVEVDVAAASQRDVEEVLAACAEEHRASQRVSVAVDIHLASDSQFFSGLSGDISEGGLFLSTYRALPVGSAVDLEFSLPGSDSPLRARGAVRWLREHAPDQPRGVGIAFEELADEDRERIHSFCALRPPLYYEDVG